MGLVEGALELEGGGEEVGSVVDFFWGFGGRATREESTPAAGDALLFVQSDAFAEGEDGEGEIEGGEFGVDVGEVLWGEFEWDTVEGDFDAFWGLGDGAVVAVGGEDLFE